MAYLVCINMIYICFIFDKKNGVKFAGKETATLGDVAVGVHQNKSFKSLSAAGLRLIGLTSVSSVTLLMGFSSCSPLS